MECLSANEDFLLAGRYTHPSASGAAYADPHGAAARRGGGTAGGFGGRPPPPPPPQSGCALACQRRQLAKLLACLGLDFAGSASYLLPVLGEGIDLAYAPAQAIALKMLFDANVL